MTTKTQKSTTATIFPEARTCEPYSTFKRGLLAPNTEVLLKTHYTQTNMIFRYILHIILTPKSLYARVSVFINK